jgi:hypothetical protein
MTLILTIATLAVLTFLGLSCRRARLELEEQLCECVQAPVAAAVGFGPNRVELVPAHPVLTGLDGGRAPAGASVGRRGRRRHLQVVEGR